MKNINILSMAYKSREVIHMSHTEFINESIEVCFNIGDGVQAHIVIPITKLSVMDELKAKEYIYNYLNKTLERKFIDEI